MKQIFPQAHWSNLDAARVLKTLETDPHLGLSSEEQKKRLAEYGPNTIQEQRSFRFWKILFDQLRSPLIFILIIAGIITILLREYTDTAVIFIAVAINTVIGVAQEGHASRAFEKLRSSVKKYAVVVRDGKQIEVGTETLVPGDIVILQPGTQVPADIRLIEEKGLEINEAILTGEWMPQEKSVEALAERLRITEQHNMAWMGTLVENGWAKGVVVATRNETELGKIASSLKQEEEITPFQKGVGRLARIIGMVIVVITFFIFGIGIFEGEPFTDMFLTAIAIAVAAIPEGLPVAVTVILAISMSRILARGGLVKKLIKAETLGSTTVIMSDKTGTLTKGEMELKEAVPAQSIIEKVGGARESVLRIGMFTSSAFLENPDAPKEQWVIRGRPTDKALLLAGIQSGISSEELLKQNPRIDFLPFESERRFAAALHKNQEGKTILYITGAPELLIDVSASYDANSSIKTITQNGKELLIRQYSAFTQQGMRVVSVGWKEVDIEELPRKNTDILLKGLIFRGFIGFHDPVREDIPGAIMRAKQAGLRPILVTGDHANTALAVAKEAGIIEKLVKPDVTIATSDFANLVVTGEMLEKMTEDEVYQATKKYSVFARVLPHQKLSLVKALHKDNEIVAMTGDGVNDAPAITEADIGIAVQSGTDVAKEASDLVLLHDSFRIIVSAIEQGRIVIDNLRKVVTYMLSTNFSEIILVSSALLMGFPLPVLPVQILWANLVEEGFMNFALAFEQGEDVLKKRDIHDSPNKIITQEMAVIILGVGIFTSLLLVALLLYVTYNNYPQDHARTLLFAGLSIDALFFVFSLKSFKKPIWKINIFENKYLFIAFSISFLFLLGALVLPPLQYLLKTTTPTLAEFGILIALGFVNLFAIEAVKWYYIRKTQ